MKQPGTIVHHDDREYLLVEGGYNENTRAVILLARPGDSRFPPDEAARPIRWGHQGDWSPVARWSPQELRVPDKRYDAQLPVIEKILEDYLARPRAPKTVAWTARKGDGFVTTLEPALPMGLATVCCDTRDAAAALPGADEIVPIDCLAMFLTNLVRQGYSGVMWNTTQPVFFCADESGDLNFLRVSAASSAAPAGASTRRPDPDQVRLEILTEADRWEPYDGAEEIEFIDNREACDQRLAETFGETPLLDWPEGGGLYSVGGGPGAPVVVKETQGQEELRHALLFTTEAAAREFIEEGETGMVVFPVQDLPAFLTCDALQGNVAALNPGGHRARSGILWSDGERVVLDSFSGFWQLDDKGFELLASNEGEE
ncbi:MAG: hypothetical protein ACYTG2_11595 [Planctomycetota bacterium]|jgi:hypothetical protein